MARQSNSFMTAALQTVLPSSSLPKGLRTTRSPQTAWKTQCAFHENQCWSFVF